MPGRPAAKNKPGERARDERRKDKKPKMQGGQWHDYDTPKDFQPASKAGSSAIPEAEGSGEQTGMRHAARVKRKRMTPVGKGLKGIKSKKPGPTMKGSRSGAKRTGRAGNPG